METGLEKSQHLNPDHPNSKVSRFSLLDISLYLKIFLAYKKDNEKMQKFIQKYLAANVYYPHTMCQAFF